MPSGSRRRKAAKKKKGNDPNNIKSSSTLSTENDDLRNQEERDSDGGDNEVVSPVSEGNNQDQFPEGGNESDKRDDPPPVRSVASESISLEGDTVDLKDVQIVGLDSERNGILEENVKEMKPEEIPESGFVDIACDENAEILTNGYYEEHNVIDLNGEPKFDEESELVKPESAILEAPESGDSIVDSVFTTVFEKVIHDVTEVALPGTSVVSGLDLKEDEEKELKPRDYSEIAQNVLDVPSEVEEDVESVAAVSEEVVHVKEPVLNETILESESAFEKNEEKQLQTRDYPSQVLQTPLDISSNAEEYIIISSESVPIVESYLDKGESIPLVSEKVIHVPETASVESMVNSLSDLKENGKEVVSVKKSSIGFDKAAISEKFIYVNGTAPTENVDTELLTGDCSARTPPDVLLDISSKVPEKEDSLPISDCSTLRARSSVESSKEPESYEISENQPLIATAPKQVEKTSWFSCCGLFDLIGTR